MDIRRQWIYFTIGGFGLGVLLRSFFDLGFTFTLFLVFMALAALCLCVVSRTAVAVFAALFLLGLALGVVRFDMVDLADGSPYLDAHIEKSVTLHAVVIDEPDERETNTKLVVRIKDAGNVPVDVKALVTTERYPRYSYGDTLTLVGKLTRPSPFLTDKGKVFDYRMYLKKEGIFYTMYNPTIDRIAVGGGNPVKRELFALKRKFLEQIGRVIEEPQVSLLGGLVVGAKRSLGEELLNDFRTTGIVHIVVLSGYNVTIVAEFIMRVLSFLPLILTWSLGVGSIILFALITGAGATIVRASIMAILVIIARATGRTYQITRALLLAGFVMVFYNPEILAFDSSFQLSFMATVGLIHLAPKLEQYFGWVPTRWQLREFATATISTQLFVLPLLLYKMGQLSIVALPVNLLVLPTVPITMLTGFLTGFVGFFNQILSLPLAYITDALLSYQLFVVEVFSKIPFASVSIETFPLWGVVLVYFLYGGILLWLYKNTTKKKEVAFI